VVSELASAVVFFFVRWRENRLTQHDDVRTTPGSGSKNDLDLLSSRETSHGVVGGELGLETEVLEVLLDLSSDERSEETKSLSLSGVELEDLLLESSGDELVSGKPEVLGGGESLEGDLVLVRLSEEKENEEREEEKKGQRTSSREERDKRSEKRKGGGERRGRLTCRLA